MVIGLFFYLRYFNKPVSNIKPVSKDKFTTFLAKIPEIKFCIFTLNLFTNLIFDYFSLVRKASIINLEKHLLLISFIKRTPMRE